MIDHSRTPGIAAGAAGVRQQFHGFQAMNLDQITEGDKVVRKVFTGTHTGDFGGLAPTGRPVEIHVIGIVRVADGRIVEHCNCVDRLRLLAQIDAAP